MRIDIEGVGFCYESAPILEGITFTVDQGEFVGVMGPNGSGKTTLLRCISNVLKPHVGTVLIDRYDVQRLSQKEIAKTIGVVPQNTSTGFAFTAFEVVLMGRSPHIGRLETESSEDLAAVRVAMESTNTWHLADRVFESLSGGEKQRVIIARALAQEPKVLLLDEPTVHLDISYQFEILELVKRLNQQRSLIIIAVFHDLNLAAQYCGRLILLNNGRIAAMGSPDEVLTAEHIQEIYNVDVLVKRNPLTNAFYVTPYLSTREEKPKKNVTVHIICGGGSGSPLIKRLMDEGYKVTAGVLNVLDTDYEIARSLGVSVIGEIPFSQITTNSFNANLDLIRDSNAVVLTDFPIGPGNLRNIEAAEAALDIDVPVVLVESSPIEQKDFTGGEAQKHLTQLKERGVMVVRDNEQAFRSIQALIEEAVEEM